MQGAAPAPSLIWPSNAPTATVSPSLAAISESTPAAGAGTSIVTLSVSSSTSGSSTATGSPAFLNQRPMVASVTDSPSVGTRMSAIVQTFDLSVVMPGLVPGIHAFAATKIVDGRDKPGHDTETDYPNASSNICLSCAMCLDISPVAVAADAGRPA